MTPTQLELANDPVALEKRFRELEAKWNEETEFLSSYQAITEHRAFQAILALGMPVVPLMLKDLEQRPRLWVWALSKITGENPVPDEAAGNILRMSEAWLNWGRQRGLV